MALHLCLGTCPRECHQVLSHSEPWEPGILEGRDLALPEARVLQNHCVVKSVSSRLQVPCPASSVFDWLFCLFANLPVSKPAGVLQSESAKCRAAVRDLSRSVCTSLLKKLWIVLHITSTMKWVWCVALCPVQGSPFPCHGQPHCSEGWEPMAKTLLEALWALLEVWESQDMVSLLDTG